MATIVLPTQYYQVFDLDFDRPVPSDGIGGWKTADLPLAVDHTALVVMHAWDVGTREEFPGWHRVVEYFPRAEQILKGPLAELLGVARSSPLKIYHVTAGDFYCRDHPGYQRTAALAVQPAPPETVEGDPVYKHLKDFRVSDVYLGTHNLADIEAGFQRLTFPPEARPLPNEDIASNANQLLALCQRDSVNHLIYTGFALNWCLLQAGGGMLEMVRHGLLCSTIREVVTALENKETARGELAKELALWRVATGFGFVYGLEPFLHALRSLPVRHTA